MVYQFLAAMVLSLHLGFILFVVFGAALVVRRRRLLPLHLAAVAWGVAVEVTGATCPLTAVENRLRLPVPAATRLLAAEAMTGGTVDAAIIDEMLHVTISPVHLRAVDTIVKLVFDRPVRFPEAA